jgi:Cu(I)/Ag(I) efflux system periplasmic protein CusF
MRYPIALIAVATAASMLSPAFADNSSERAASRIAQAQAGAPATLADGEVRKVDKDAGKITLRHGPIESLNMPAMSMVFRVKDPAMLDQVKAGDKVKFAAELVGGQYTVTQIERLP